ncbi:hypothetical protein [Streptomyces sp. NPDC001507]|uniref:hypothetical protein n=1 Tax=Streptomyces sp. NPDC001507 TaxID=3364579 RepID=UPI00368EB770
MTTSTSWAVARLLRDRNAALYLTGVVMSGFGTSALGLRLLLPVFGAALLLTAGALGQRSASRTAARSPSDANPA